MRSRSLGAASLASLASFLLGCATVGAGARAAITPTDEARLPDGRLASDTLPVTAADVRAVQQLVTRYLRVAGNERAPSAYWSREEQERFPAFDLAGGQTYRSPLFRATYGAWTSSIDMPTGIPTGMLEVTVTFTPRPGATQWAPGAARAARPTGVRLFARREHGAWRLRNALFHETRRWPETRIGSITFRHHPVFPLDTARAEDAVRFVDSLSARFGVTRPRDMLYVITRGSDELLFLMGFVDPVRRFGGEAIPADRLIVTGAFQRGERHYHELAHLVFAQLPVRGNHALVVEGAAGWAAMRMGEGSDVAGRAAVAAVLDRRPALTLEQVARARDRLAEPAFYPTGAWLVGLVYDATGARGVRALLDARGTDEMLRIARVHTRLSKGAMERRWREWARGVPTVPVPAPRALTDPEAGRK